MRTHATKTAIKTVRPDLKGRITLGELAKGVSGFRIVVANEQQIILEPLVEIPACEKWLLENKTALKQVKKGMENSAKGKLVNRGSFAKYIDDELE